MDEAHHRELVPDRQRELGFRTKESRVPVEARPNAPQLIRLVRHPYALSVQRLLNRLSFEHGRVDRSRPRFGAEHAAASGEIAVILREGPVAVHDRLQPRPRLSAAAWLASRPDSSEDR